MYDFEIIPYLAFYNLFALLGFPKICQSDNGAKFDNQIIKALTELAAIDHQLITPYHPQAKSVAKWFVQTAQNVLKKMVEGNSHNWAAYVPSVQMGMNISIPSRTVEYHNPHVPISKSFKSFV